VQTLLFPSYQRIGIVESDSQIHGPLYRNAFYSTAQRLPPKPVQLTTILDSSDSRKANPNPSLLLRYLLCKLFSSRPTSASASSNQIVKSKARFAETLSIRPHSGSNQTCLTNDYFGQQ
jgi:hypothetical protein